MGRTGSAIWFCFLDANEILERGLYGDAIKRGSTVVDGSGWNRTGES